MNNAGRKQIEELIDKLEGIKGEIEEMQSAEQEKFDNLSEGLQQSERGQGYEQAAEYLQTAVDSIDEALSNLESARE